MSARVAVLVFPGTNSEDETLRALRATGLDAALVHWSRPGELAGFDAFVQPTFRRQEHDGGRTRSRLSRLAQAN